MVLVPLCCFAARSLLMSLVLLGVRDAGSSTSFFLCNLLLFPLNKTHAKACSRKKS